MRERIVFFFLFPFLSADHVRHRGVLTIFPPALGHQINEDGVYDRECVLHRSYIRPPADEPTRFRFTATQESIDIINLQMPKMGGSANPAVVGKNLVIVMVPFPALSKENSPSFDVVENMMMVRCVPFSVSLSEFLRALEGGTRALGSQLAHGILPYTDIQPQHGTRPCPHARYLHTRPYSTLLKLAFRLSSSQFACRCS